MTYAKSANGHAATRLRSLLAEKDIILAPGVYDGFSARIALEVGFDCLYMVWQPSLCSPLPRNQEILHRRMLTLTPSLRLAQVRALPA
jgi:hypothetical protein